MHHPVSLFYKKGTNPAEIFFIWTDNIFLEIHRLGIYQMKYQPGIEKGIYQM
jgi:hypothetical protein